MILHLAVSVRGVLSLSDREIVRQWKGSVSIDGKALRTAREIRGAFMDQLANGNEFVPCGECDNFDPKKGCQGHKDERKAVPCS